jgi:excisionase family DNA binding protein
MRLPGHLTVREVAIKLQTSERRILGWINEGKLEAVNVATSGKRWQIPESALHTIFKPKTKPQREERKADVIEFF